MDRVLDRLLPAARRVLACKIYPVTRSEWQSTMRTGGEPTQLNAPLTPFGSIDRKVRVVVCASSARQRGVPGFHVVREDPADAPDILNTDSYDEIDLTSQLCWPQVLATAGLSPAEVDKVIASYVFLTPKRRSDHHSRTVPSDIANAKPK